MQQVLCFGEILLRMSPEKGWPDNPMLKTYVGGAEVNVAIALAGWGINSYAGVAMPDNFISSAVKTYLRDQGVQTDKIITSGSRVGTYYLHQGADLKSDGVVYDRAHSSFADLQPGTIDWDELLDDVSHLHLTAISPAVSASAATLCKELLTAATKKDIFISLDLNYRSKLWKYGKEPLDIMPELAGYADLIMGNIWAAHQMLGIYLPEGAADTTDQEALTNFAARTSEAIIKAFPRCSRVANTFRFNEGQDQIKYFGTYYYQQQIFCSRQKIYTGILDKAGSGDCFMAGLLYGILQGFDPQVIIDFASCAATGKFYETGDHTRQSVAAIQEKLKEQASEKS